jgi:hypothetical protein
MFQKNLIDLVKVEPGTWVARIPDLIIAGCLLGNVLALSLAIGNWLS